MFLVLARLRAFSALYSFLAFRVPIRLVSQLSILPAMRLPRLFFVFLSTLILLLLAPNASADRDSDTLGGAINTLDHFMQAGVDNDARRGAGLLEIFDVNARRAEYDTRLLYRRQENLLSAYVSIASDLYGYEIQKGRGATSVELEGGIETSAGVTAEFKARVVYRNNRWRIADIEID